MGSLTAEQRALKKAYVVFCSELENHLAAAKKALSGPPPQGADPLPELGMVFHRVKGGAGFFGLDVIARQAAELEDLFLQPLELLHKHLSEARDLVRQLEETFRDLPSSGDQENKNA